MQDTKTFVNPKGYWRYEGGFIVTLFPDTPTAGLPSNVRVEGNIVTISEGSLGQSIGGIGMESKGSPFHWGYSMIQYITKSDGELLWVNDRLKNS